jgi:predicted helicase
MVVHCLYQQASIFPLESDSDNGVICFSDPGSRTNYCVLATDSVADLHFGAAVDGYQQVSRYRYADGQRIDNITDWALEQFSTHYAEDPCAQKTPDHQGRHLPLRLLRAARPAVP